MRVAVVSVRQESNSFVRGTTSMEAFEERGLLFGADMLVPGADAPISGFVAGLSQSDLAAEIVPVVRAVAVAGPALSAETLAVLTAHVEAGLGAVGRVDAVFAALHGACVTPDGVSVSVDTLFAQLIRRIIGDNVPLVIALDHHAWVTAELTAAADIIVGHRTQPHDPYDTGVCAGRLLARRVHAGIRPNIAFRRIPMLTHQEQFTTASGPMNDWFTLARDLEQTPGIWSISPFPMQPWLDVPDPGWSVTVVGDPHDSHLDAVADQLAAHAWQHRDAFNAHTSLPIDTAVAAALTHAHTRSGIAVLADLGDSVFGGAHGDSTILLEKLLAQRLPGPALVAVTDPINAIRCHEHAPGDTLTLDVGGTLSGATPLRVRGVLRTRTHGRLNLPGFIHESTDQGRVALIECPAQTGHVLLALLERCGVSSNHPLVFEHLGVNINQAALLVLKSAVNVQGYSQYTPTLIPHQHARQHPKQPRRPSLATPTQIPRTTFISVRMRLDVNEETVSAGNGAPVTRVVPRIWRSPWSRFNLKDGQAAG